MQALTTRQLTRGAGPVPALGQAGGFMEGPPGRALPPR
ncbi:hypothetical protein PENCOP_c049G03772, partial [Penicillium coprophilum]